MISNQFVKSEIGNRHSAIRGLTLIEVMLALAILGVGVTVLVSTTAKCLSVARKAKNYENARRLMARVELEEPLFEREEIEESDEGGTFPSPFEGYRWSRKIELEGEEEDNLFKITMTVTWSERGKDISEQVVTYRHAPENVKGGSFESGP